MKDGKYVVEVKNETLVGQPMPYDPTYKIPFEFNWWFLGSGIIIFLFLLFTSVVVVKQQRRKIIERFGKFKKVASPGLSFKFPLIDWVAAELDLRLIENKVTVETKTKDNVFLGIGIAIQYYILPEKASDAFYSLEEPENQIRSYVFDTVRAKVPELSLDEVFEKKEEVAKAVKDSLSSVMAEYGYFIVTALITDIDPNESVKRAMNEINTQQRLRVAANEKGEAEKILVIKNAEAEAESKKLQGQGIANQRKAIIEGLKDSVQSMSEGVGVSSEEVMNLVLLTQYFDTLKDIGSKGSSIFLPSSPGGMKDFANEIRTAIISAEKVK